MKRVRSAALFFFSCTLAWSVIPLVSHAATDVVITQNTTFAPGEYFFGSLTIASSSILTLQGNPTATTSYKGAIIHAETMAVEAGAVISANSQGYDADQGPGASSFYYAGASYGGSGLPNSEATAPTYGSALEPVDLGSGGSTQGGGAMQLLVSGTFTNNGTITANGGISSSGGSILVKAGTLAGDGSFKALGGKQWVNGYYRQPGGGGRIMIRYASSSFTGTADVSGGCTVFSPQFCAESGTAGFIDTSTNTLLLPYSWRFQTNDSPISFTSIVVTNGIVTSNQGVTISADRLSLSARGSVSFGDDIHLRVPLVSLVEASTLSFSNAKDAVITDLTISDGSKVTTAPGQVLNLSLASLTISSDSSVDVSAKGYPSMEGPGAPPPDSANYTGASYGGIGYKNTATSTYGDADNPTDFGSGAYGPGGGALALTISGTLTNDGIIAANGKWSGSGGSILLHAHSLIGNGAFAATGGERGSSTFFGPGGGGRIALYTDSPISSFGGKIEAKGACTSFDGYLVYCAGDGTVVKGSNLPEVSNVLFLPGIEASRLYRPDYVGGTDRLWEPNIDSDVQDLYMNGDGSSVRPDIYTKERDVVDELPSGENIYKSFIGKLNELKTSGTIADWEPIAYDWRLSLDDILTYGNDVQGRIYYAGDLRATSTPYIIQELKQLAATSKSGKVTIVAHSNGGLLAKRLTELLGPTESARLIDKMIFVAVPQAGTPTAVAAGLHGYGQDHQFGLITSKNTARTFGSKSPMEYHLLPSAAYFTYVDDPAVTFDASLTDWIAHYGERIHSQELLHTFLADSYGRVDAQTGDINQPIQLSDVLLSGAESLHAILDNWTPPAGVVLTQIAGWGVPKTVSGITYKKRGAGVTPEINTTVDGDGTVVTPSALWTSTTTGARNYWVNLRGYNSDHPFSSGFGWSTFDHSRILETNPVINFISDQITNTIKPLSEYSYLSTEAPISSEKHLRYALHSPLTLNLYDAEGRHTGVSTTTGQVEEQVPGTYYVEFGEAKYLFSDASSNANIIMNGYDTGTFTLNVDEYTGNVLTASTTFKDVPTTASTVASLSVQSDISTLSSMVVDKNGDGSNVITMVPKIGETVSYEPPAPEPEQVQESHQSSGGGGGVWFSIPALAPTVTTSGPTSTPITEKVPIAASSTQVVVASVPAKSLIVRQKAVVTPAPQLKKVSVPVAQTASVYDASQQSLLKKLGTAVYNEWNGFWLKLKKFFH